MRRIWTEGDERLDRTGVGTRALFGTMLRCDLSGDKVPLLTTKRVYWKAAAREMLWFLTGDTNIRPLLQQGVTIWSDWPLAKYRRETNEEISQEEFERRIVENVEFAARWGISGRSTASNGSTGRRTNLPATDTSGRARASTRWLKSSKACGPTPAAVATSSKAGTSPSSTGWRCRRATRATSSTSPAID